jgi:DNA-binding NarL/FixJ family response regulator
MSGPQHMLIVEDDPAAQEYFRYRVQRDFPGIQVSIAGTLATAKAALATLPIDCMLIDPGLPDSSGYYTIKALMIAAPTVAAAIMTGYVKDGDKQRALANGAVAYYDKFELMTDWERIQLLHQFRAEAQAEAAESAERSRGSNPAHGREDAGDGQRPHG